MMGRDLTNTTRKTRRREPAGLWLSVAVTASAALRERQSAGGYAF
jgi:hypothetical protein